MVFSLPFESLNLTEGWRWKKSPLPALSDPDDIILCEPDKDWKTCSQFPSLVHCELLAAGEIEDPFLGLNEKDVQWVGESDWMYEYRSCWKKSDSHFTDLVIEGLDTFATVYLNGKKVLTTNNMFVPYRVDVKALLRENANVLTIIFTSAFLKGRYIEEERLGPGNHLTAWNGDPSRLFVRKAQYHWSWDWGPHLSTMGPWKPMRLEHYSARIGDFLISPLVDKDLQVSLKLSVLTNQRCSVRFSIETLDETTVIRSGIFEVSENSSTVMWKFDTGEISLWNVGRSELYTVKAELLDPTKEGVIQSEKKKIGFRRLVVVQEDLVDEPGTSFYFEVNNVAIFAGGSNWIPIDSFLTNAIPERYRKWLELLVAGSQNMIRVWGGGIYESDCFYELCDSLGILVWQDFTFACGIYPAHDEFIQSVRAEAEANVKRIRHHPSLAIFAGNNEDYQVAEAIGMDDFPARQIYEIELPEIVNRLTNTFYHPGSPWGGSNTRDPTVGDIHQWSVWHGTQEPYQDWDKLEGRFVSEFGMQGYPNISTIDFFLDGAESERFPQSETVGFHNKAAGAERRLECYLIENIRHSFDMEGYVYATQFIQAEALSSAYRLWRRRFQGPGKYYVGGALVWQLNDVYPCISWSIVDYFLRPKAAYYSIKRSLAPISVGMKRFTEKTFESNHSALYTEIEFVEFWAANSSLMEAKVDVILEAHNLLTGEVVYSESWYITLESNRSNELRRMKVPTLEDKGAVVLSVRLLDHSSKAVLSRFSVFPEPYKFLTFPPDDLKFDLDIAKESLSILSQRPVKGLILHFDSDVALSDNCLDLIPGEERIVSIKRLKETTKVSWRHLGGQGEL